MLTHSCESSPLSSQCYSPPSNYSTQSSYNSSNNMSSIPTALHYNGVTVYSDEYAIYSPNDVINTQGYFSRE